VRYTNNTPVADFYCSACQSDFELKSRKGPFGPKIIAGSYAAMIERTGKPSSPHFILLQHDGDVVIEVSIIPNFYFVPGIIEPRVPLSSDAQRAGWTGSVINIARVPDAGRVYYVRDSIALQPSTVLEGWRRASRARDRLGPSGESWLFDVMRCIDQIGKGNFSLSEVYQFESDLATLHPNNGHIHEKIRQQLQVLRDIGYLRFVSRGFYQLL
jgi:type II restriction enzyme